MWQKRKPGKVWGWRRRWLRRTAWSTASGHRSTCPLCSGQQRFYGSASAHRDTPDRTDRHAQPYFNYGTVALDCVEPSEPLVDVSYSSMRWDNVGLLSANEMNLNVSVAFCAHCASGINVHGGIKVSPHLSCCLSGKDKTKQTRVRCLHVSNWLHEVLTQILWTKEHREKTKRAGLVFAVILSEVWVHQHTTVACWP